MLWCEDEWTADREAEARRRTEQQGPPMQQSMVARYEREAKKHWDLFYKRNTTNFFKDRHYLHVVFPELATIAGLSPTPTHIPGRGPGAGRNSASSLAATPLSNLSSSRLKLLEVGCGVGNAVFPLLDLNPRLTAIAIDFSNVAIDFVQTQEDYKRLCSQQRCLARVCDITKDNLPSEVSIHLEAIQSHRVIACHITSYHIIPYPHTSAFNLKPYTISNFHCC